MALPGGAALPAPRPVIVTRYGGPDGLRCLRRLAAQAAAYLLPRGRLYILVTDWAYPPRVLQLFQRHGFALRRAARVYGPFQPAEYERIAPGLFAYLDRRASLGLASYRRAGTWCYLGVSLFEARSVERLAASGGRLAQEEKNEIKRGLDVLPPDRLGHLEVEEVFWSGQGASA
jgi:hypothetical protein